jgi:putative phosphoesterase
MRIIILSDIHDHLAHLDPILRWRQEAEVHTLLFCGDLCSPFVVDRLAAGWAQPIHIVFGNNDGDLWRITARARQYAHVQLHGEIADLVEHEGTLVPVAQSASLATGPRIAVVHYDTLGPALAASGRYDLVCYGHNHINAISAETVGGRRVVQINPGSVMGYQPAVAAFVAPTFVVYETEAGSAATYALDPGGAISLQG